MHDAGRRLSAGVDKLPNTSSAIVRAVPRKAKLMAYVTLLHLDMAAARVSKIEYTITVGQCYWLQIDLNAASLLGVIANRQRKVCGKVTTRCPFIGVETPPLIGRYLLESWRLLQDL